MTLLRTTHILAMSFASAATALAVGPYPLEAPLLVNVSELGQQQRCDVAMAPDGRSRVVWEWPDEGDVFTRSFTAGNAPGAEMRINTTLPSSQLGPRVAFNSSSDWTAQWMSNAQVSASGWDLIARGTTGNGSILGTEKLATWSSGWNVISHATARTNDDRTLVVWSTNNNLLVFAQRFDASQNYDGTPFAVSTEPLDSSLPQIEAAALGENEVVVTWRAIADGVPTLYVRRIFEDGNLGPETVITTNAGYPVIGADDRGGFWVAYRASNAEIRLQRYEPDGFPNGAPTCINCGSFQFLAFPGDLAASRDGGVVAVWRAESQTAEKYVVAREYDRLGLPVGDAFVVAQVTPDDSQPRIAISDSTFEVCWTGSDSNGNGVLKRRYARASISADGFESGDTTYWSAESP
jgi:hypothetical protein